MDYNKQEGKSLTRLRIRATPVRARWDALWAWLLAPSEGGPGQKSSDKSPEPKEEEDHGEAS